MAALLEDVRKTALGAGGLVLLAVWFSASDGPADDAVKGAAALAQRQKTAEGQAASPAATPAAQAMPTASWFAPDDSDEPRTIDVPADSTTQPDVNADPTLVLRPPPSGPDFPPGYR